MKRSKPTISPGQARSIAKFSEHQIAARKAHTDTESAFQQELLKKPMKAMTRMQIVLLCTVVFGPLLFYMVLEYRIYFTTGAHKEAGIAALLLMPVGLYALQKYRSRLAPRYSVVPLDYKSVLMLPIVLVLVLYSWILMLFASRLLLPDVPLAEHIYQVIEVKESTSAKAHCRYKVRFAAWPGRPSSEQCAAHMDPYPVLGDRLHVQTYQWSGAIYVRAIDR